MRIKTSAAILAAAIALAGCTGDNQNETAGSIIGGIGGAVLGSQIGGGTGNIIATAVGTLAGALIGNQIGKSLDETDKLKMHDAEAEAHKAPIGKQIVWDNPKSGNSGTVTPVRDGHSSGSGAYCREYETTVTVAEKKQDAYGTACQQPDGSWKIIDS